MIGHSQNRNLTHNPKRKDCSPISNRFPNWSESGAEVDWVVLRFVVLFALRIEPTLGRPAGLEVGPHPGGDDTPGE